VGVGVIDVDGLRAGVRYARLHQPVRLQRERERASERKHQGFGIRDWGFGFGDVLLLGSHGEHRKCPRGDKDDGR